MKNIDTRYPDVSESQMKLAEKFSSVMLIGMVKKLNQQKTY